MLERQLEVKLAENLRGQRLLGSVPAKDCKVRFVIPVNAERGDRIMVLLQSLANQDVAPGVIEVILVVNNHPDDGTDRWREVYELNQRLLAEELTCTSRIDGSELTVHKIDLSSPDCWAKNCNVGVARQRGLLEATLRFVRHRFNGLLVHTDADCRFEDISMVRKLLWIFEEDRRLVGMGGTYSYEIDVDDPESDGLLGLLPRYRRVWLYDKLTDDITMNRVGRLESSFTLGRFIVNRAYQGYLAGGFPPIAVCEDYAFADALRAYADDNDMNFGSGHELRFGPVTALRISDRTPTSIREQVDRLKDAAYVDDVFSPGAKILLTDDYIERLCTVVRTMERGEARLHYLYVKDPINSIRVKGLA